MKRNLSTPIFVIANKKHGTENAILDVQTGGHPWLLVAIRFAKGIKKISKGNLILTFYGIEKHEVPPGIVCWGKKP